jgi:hypothetical protein
MVELPTPVVAMLRRQTGTRLYAAMHLDSAVVQHAAGSRIDSIALVLTSAPDTVQVIALQSAEVSDDVVLSAHIPSRPGLIGIEFAADVSRPAGRLRQGVIPPAPLSAMQPGTLDVSGIVLFRAHQVGQLSAAGDSALTRMASSPVVRKDGRIGLYWETYGLSASDSVTFHVRVLRTTQPSGIRRLGMRLGIAGDLNVPISIRWTETTGPTSAVVEAGPVPVIGRSLVLDTKALVSGEYVVELRTRHGALPEATTSSRLIIPE